MEDENQLPILSVNLTDYENFTEDQYLEEILGPKHLPLKLVLPVTVIYALIFVTGVFGNAVTCLVIVRNPAMQTATNHYLFSLAVSDLLLLMLGLPNELGVFWQQYPWELPLIVCKGRAFVSEMSSYVSVLTIVAFSLERYFAICHPLRLYVMSGLKRHIIIIIAAWVIAFVCAMPFFWYTDVSYVEWPPGSRNASKNSAVCAMFNMPDFPLYEMSCLIFFLVPMVIIMWLYAHMGLTIQSTTLGHRIDGTVHGETRPSQSRKAIIRMLSAVVITFFICWAPFHAQRLLYVYAHRETFSSINEWLYPLGGSLYYFSTTINPILYNVMSAKYRNAFKETLCCSPTHNHQVNTEADLNSLRETGVCRCSSIRSSQIVRIRSLYCNNQSINNRCQSESPRDHSPHPEDENDNHHHHHHHSNHWDRNMSSLQVPTDTFDHQPAITCDTKKCSMIIHSKNGRAKCHATEQDESAVSGESRI